MSIRPSRGKLGSVALSAALLMGSAAGAVASERSPVPPPVTPNPAAASPHAAGPQGTTAPDATAPGATAPGATAPGAVAAPNVGGTPSTTNPNAAPADLADLPLPDLAMARTRDLKLVNRPDGHLELRFTSTVVNIGHGPLVVLARRAAVGAPWTVAQQILAADGSVIREIPLPLTPIWGGDGHNHWHIPGVTRYRLLRLSDGQEVGANHKIGFCFFDNLFYRALPDTPDKAGFPNDHGCAHGDRQATRIRMGLSVGYGDVYRWKIPGQSIDINDLPAGRYRLEGRANGEDALYESNPDDNRTWTDFELVRQGNTAQLRVLGSGSDESPDNGQPGDHGSVTFHDGQDDSAPDAGPQCDAEDQSFADCTRRS